jgi:hypothetical protein
VATSTAVRPLGTACSAHTTAPLPNPISSTPSSVSEGHSRRCGIGSPRRIIATISTVPAAIQRIAAISSGGIDSSEMRMARYAVPQIRQIAIHAM